MNSYVKWGLIIAVVLLVLIYRKKIFRFLQPAMTDLKRKLEEGEGLAPKVPAGKFVKNTSGEQISNMLKETMSNYSVRDLEAATRDWSKVNTGFDKNFLDNGNIKSRPVTINEVIYRGQKERELGTNAVMDIGRIVRNQVVISDLWGRRCCANGHGNGYKGVAYAFNMN